MTLQAKDGRREGGADENELEDCVDLADGRRLDLSGGPERDGYFLTHRTINALLEEPEIDTSQKIKYYVHLIVS